jgi:hypothetical protein
MRSQSSGKRGRNGFFEKEPDMRPSPGARSFVRGREIEVATSVKKRRSSVTPAGLVEIDGKEEAGLVLKQRVDARDEGLSLGVATRQVPANDVVRDRKEPTARTFSAFDAWLLAHATDPLVGACGRVPRPARLAALEPPRVHIFATSEERPKKRDLRLRR